MRVLVVCEFSGAVRDALIERGHFARSCDLLSTEALTQPVEYRGAFSCYDHEQYDPTCDACEHDEPWCHRHGMYAHECTCLGPTEDEAEYAETCEQGARHRAGDLFGVEDVEGYDLLIAHPPCTYLCNSGVRWLKDNPTRWEQMLAGAEFFKRILDLPIPRIAVENPIMHKHAKSIIGVNQTQVIQPWQFGHGETKATCLWLKGLPPLRPTDVVSGREHRIHMMPPGPDRWKERSKTFTGIAAAMAEQWGNPEPAAMAA
jgi:hypothetical protein